MAVALSVVAMTACGEGGENGEIQMTPELAARVKVSGEAARATALARVPGGKVRSGELEEEGGKLIYSFDIEVAGNEGVQEVQVDALDGKVVGAGARDRGTGGRRGAERRVPPPRWWRRRPA